MTKMVKSILILWKELEILLFHVNFVNINQREKTNSKKRKTHIRRVIPTYQQIYTI